MDKFAPNFGQQYGSPIQSPVTNIFDDRLRGVDSVAGGIKNCQFPLTTAVAVNTR